uniref:NADH-ubiquinone oxidoreductase chain 3 n=1 Tax=Aspidiphorus orbiculatus TaxID=577441 RepID=A0A0S2M6J7_9CUCU|nr:NADH deshydrogenase subunit 3 [Aspidiphorus orbiculatus]
MLIFTLILFLMLLISLLILVLNLITFKVFYDREKNSPFECGFDPKTNARLPFSLNFFLIAIIFLIFDVEMTLLTPMIKYFLSSNTASFSATLIFFITILLAGLYHEWKQGALNWKI